MALGMDHALLLLALPALPLMGHCCRVQRTHDIHHTTRCPGGDCCGLQCGLPASVLELALRQDPVVLPSAGHQLSRPSLVTVTLPTGWGRRVEGLLPRHRKQQAISGWLEVQPVPHMAQLRGSLQGWTGPHGCRHG